MYYLLQIFSLMLSANCKICPIFQATSECYGTNYGEIFLYKPKPYTKNEKRGT